MSVTAPSQGEATKAAWAAAIIAEQSSQAASTYAVATLGVISNGSFELGTVTPSGWGFTAQTAGTGAIDTTDSSHGAQSFKITSLGGGSNGGGYLEMSEFSECSPKRPFLVGFQSKSSVAGVKNIVSVRWYSTPDEGDYLSTDDLWTQDANPTSWTLYQSLALPPANARYFKLRLTGCDISDTTAGSAWFDDVRINSFSFTRKVEFRQAGTCFFTVPENVYALRVKAIGGGGGGAGSSGGSQGAGGGGGGYSESIVAVTPGQVVTCVMGAGGTAGAASGNGGNGGDTTFETTTVIAKGGTGGTANDATPPGGAGGSITGAAGDITLPGGDGYIAATTSGNGGYAINGGGGASGVTASNGKAGAQPGEGGSGGHTLSNTGGAGAPGAIILEW